MSTEDKILNAALEYYDMGWCPIPAKKGEKHPIIQWKEYQSNRPSREQIIQWFENNDYNIFLLTGGGIIVVDIDTNDHGLISEEAEELISKLPTTKTSQTGSGGRHYFFKTPRGLKIPNKAGILPGVDIRAEGGGVIVPPSIHPNGNEYIWTDEFELAEFPYELFKPYLEDISNPSNNNKTVFDNDIPEGMRNSTLVSITGTLALGIPDKPELIKKIIHSLNMQKCNPPLSVDEVEKNILSNLPKYLNPIQIKSDRLMPISLRELFLSETDHTPKYMIEGLLPYQGTTVLSGNPGNCKTWLTLMIAKSVSEGISLFDTFSSSQTGVLILDKENSVTEIKKRFSMIGASQELPIYIHNTKDFKLNGSTKQQLLEYMLENRIGLLIIDSLRRINPGDENSSKDINEIFELVNSFHTHSISVLITHHHKKNQNGSPLDSSSKMRGSSDILASIDSHLIIEKVNNKQLRIEQNKNRYDKEVKSFTLDIETDGTDYFKFIYSGESKVKQTKEQESSNHILNILYNSQGWVSRGTIIESVKESSGFSYSVVDRALEHLFKDNQVLRQKNGNVVQYKAVDSN